MLPPEHTSSVLVPGGWEMQLRRWGSGPPLVLLHGFTGDSRSWPAAAIAELAAEYTVLAVDLPGHGDSTLPARSDGFSFRDLLGDLRAGLSGAGVERAHLLGYSMGGRVALGFALRFPGSVGSLILESASPGLAEVGARDERVAADGALAAQIDSRGMEWFVDHWTRIPLFRSQEALEGSIREELRLRRLQNRPAGLAFSLRSLGSGVQPSYWDTLQNFEQPTLLMVGSLDEKFLALGERMDSQLSRSTLEVFTGIGHAVHLEAPQRWAGAVLGHLALHGPLDPPVPSR